MSRTATSKTMLLWISKTRRWEFIKFKETHISWKNRLERELLLPLFISLKIKRDREKGLERRNNLSIKL